MPRSRDQARYRLQQSALELFTAQGFDNTTAAQIATHAGLTERTYFRHFTDKREVLFDGQEQFLAALLDGLANAPDGPLLSMLLQAYRGSYRLLERNRSFSGPRSSIINTTPALQEREAAKLASINRALAVALTDRGADESQAALATEVAMVAFKQATRQWLTQPQSDLDTLLDEAFTHLTQLTSDLAARPNRLSS